MEKSTMTFAALAILSISLGLITVRGVAYATDVDKISSEDTISTVHSPDNSLAAVWTKKHELLLSDKLGKPIFKVPGHGAAPVFSTTTASWHLRD